MKYLLILLIALSSCVTPLVSVELTSESKEDYQDNLEKKEEEIEQFDSELVEEHFKIIHSLDTAEFNPHQLQLPH